MEGRKQVYIWTSSPFIAVDMGGGGDVIAARAMVVRFSEVCVKGCA